MELEVILSEEIKGEAEVLFLRRQISFSNFKIANE